MSTLLIIFISLVGFHFVIEAILLPDFRMIQRFKLVAKQDEIKNLLSQEGISSERRKILKQILQLTQVGLRHLADFDMFVLLRANKIGQENQDVKNAQTLYSLMLNKPENKDLLQLQDNVVKIIGKTAISNHAGWIPYIIIIAVPIALLSIVIGFAVKKCGQYVRETKEFIVNPKLDKTSPGALEAIFQSHTDGLSWN
jgi:hypothetical protein